MDAAVTDVVDDDGGCGGWFMVVFSEGQNKHFQSRLRDWHKVTRIIRVPRVSVCSPSVQANERINR